MAPSLIFLLFLLQIFALCSHQVVAQTGPKTWQTLPFNPGALPLAVRSPYLNTWAAQGNNPASVNNLWPTLWNSNITGWYAAVTVDGVAYRVLGAAPIQNTTTANQTAAIFTPTQTSVLLQAGPVSINATFLSPVEPTDLVRQSIPFSYFFMTAQSSDGANHDVKMYSDISAEWISGDDNREVIWTSDVNNDRVILSTQLQTESPFTDFSDHAHDSTAYYCMKSVPGLTWRIGADVQDRGIFTNTSQLTNTTDPNFRPVSDSWPVFGIAVDVGSVGSTPSSPVIWVIGVVRNQSVQYLGSDATTKQRSAYYWANFTTAVDVAEFFLNDFDRAVSAANELDAKILSNAGGQNIPQFANLLSLSLRQAMASTEITISKDSSGNWNTSDVMTFMKNMGSAGNQGGVNNVDTLYASLPVFLYLNPSLAGYLLRPLLEYQESTAFNLPYAAQNLGVSYPIATGNSTQHNFGIEQSANMLIMTLAHAQASGDGTLLSQHYNKLLSWTDYLVNNSLSPNNQFSADVGSVNAVNQTNLALKGIIGIGAMAKICSYAGQQDQSSKYQSTAQNYIQQWAALTVASDQSHLLMNYGVQSSSGLVYNLYADKLLGLNLVPTSVYQVQQNFYITAAPQVKFGLPLDNSDATFSRTDWMMFAASSSGQDALGPMVNQLLSFASVNMNNAPFASMFDPTSGQVSGGLNSPGQGAMFAPLILNQTIKTPSVDPSLSASQSGSKKSNGGVIAGALIGALVGVGGAALAIFFYIRRRRQHRTQMNYVSSEEPKMSATSPLDLSEGVQYEPFRFSGERSHSTGNLVQDPYTTFSDGSYSDRRDSQVIDGGYGPSHSSRPSVTSTELGPSASQAQFRETSTLSYTTGSTSSGSGMAATSHRSGRSDSTRTSMTNKQSMMNQELRNEVDNLRREMERIREERVAVIDEAPPSYTDVS